MVYSYRCPLQLPELRSRIGQFLSRNDLVACSQVCKDWTNDFSYLLWHTIDFDVHMRFIENSHHGITRHGHRIRVVQNLQELEQLEILQHSSVCRLQSLSVTILDHDRFQEICHAILGRNRDSLTYIGMLHETTKDTSISDAMFNPETLLLATSINGDIDNGIHITRVNKSINKTTAEFTKLTHLRFEGLAFSQSVFVSLLQMCPLLATLDIRDMSIVSAIPSISSSIYSLDNQQRYGFKHLKLTCLIAPIVLLFPTDHPAPTSDDNTSIILAHFPNLVQWRTWHKTNTTPPFALIKEQTSRWCPNLNQICLEITSSQAVVDMLDQAFDRLNFICLEHKKLTPETLQAVIRHREFLEVIMTFDPSIGFYSMEHVPGTMQYIMETDSAIQQMLRSCPRIKDFQLPEMEMDMNEAEKVEWACKNLEVFYVRIRGLETEEQITRVCRLWMEGKEQKRKLVAGKMRIGAGSVSFDDYENIEMNESSATSHVLSAVSGDLSIEERVLKFLSKFEKLKELWLGTKVWII
ncbi:hypothetical protein BGX27_004683 [Mortierella sp. AM989]|nr:hypothetical protein BGX27_004683 [Mortierella sp. AM989]